MPSPKQLIPPPLRQVLRSIQVRAMQTAMRGDTVECPCCGGKFKKFLPAGMSHRPNARCPKCGSLERHRLVWLYLRDKTDLLKKGGRVLDIAPEKYLQEKLRDVPTIEYMSIDLKSPLAMRQMDITNLEFPDGQFDVIFCNHVLEHIPDDRRAMREMLRVLKPNGWAILQTPVNMDNATTDEDASVTDPAERQRRFGQEDHVRTYGRDFFDRLRDIGWAIELIPYAKNLGVAATQRYGLDPDERIVLGRKP